MSIFKTIGKIGKGALGVLAPTIAGALPGPVGSIARKAVTAVLGLPPESAEEEIEKAIAAANPETLLALRKADADFRAQMKQLDVDFERIASEDRASARARQVAIKDRTPPVLAWTIIVAWLGITVDLLFYTPPETNTRLLDIMFGILTSAVVGVINYYFGSSAGSARKTDILANGK